MSNATMKVSVASCAVSFVLAMASIFIGAIPTPVPYVLMGLGSVAFVVFIVDVFKTIRRETRNNTAWLRCELSEGMFPDEFAVHIINDPPTHPTSFFSNKEYVREDISSILVQVVDSNKSHSLVRVPGDPFWGSNTITVKNSQLTYEK